jgi:fluoride exporter
MAIAALTAIIYKIGSLRCFHKLRMVGSLCIIRSGGLIDRKARMVQVLLVGLGGMIGSIMRYALASGVQDYVRLAFPAGTLAVNLLGCLFIGAFASLAEVKQWTNVETRLLVTTGFLGGFTTFSAFGYETFRLMRDNLYAYAVINVLANVLFGIMAVGIGWAVAKYFAT